MTMRQLEHDAVLVLQSLLPAKKPRGSALCSSWGIAANPGNSIKYRVEDGKCPAGHMSWMSKTATVQSSETSAAFLNSSVRKDS